MVNEMDKIKQFIASYIEISEEELEGLLPKFSIRKYNKKAIIHSYGEICKYLYFVDKGILRVFFIDEHGDEKTFHFALENTIATDYESFLKQIPSNYTIQVIEEATLIQISLETVQYIYRNLRYGEKLGRLLAEEYIFIFTKKTNAIYTKTPMQRYQSFKKLFPDVFQQIPQHYIASYLHITPVHLSRLISQTNKSKKS